MEIETPPDLQPDRIVMGRRSGRDIPGKFGSTLQQHAETSAILVSLLLQHGVELHVIKHSISGPIAHALSLADAEDTH